MVLLILKKGTQNTTKQHKLNAIGNLEKLPASAQTS
jgi:hypothetical protein